MEVLRLKLGSGLPPPNRHFAVAVEIGLGKALTGNHRVATLGRRWLVKLLLLWVLGFAVGPAFGQVSREYQLKAVFLWRLAQFTEWPATAFEGGESPIVIGVLGANPFGNALETAVRDETAHGRRMVLQYYERVEQIRTCHVLYISRSETRRAREIIAGLAGRGILTVSDIEDFVVSSGGMVRFVTEQNRIKLRINIEAVTKEHLKLDARLLRAAEVTRAQ